MKRRILMLLMATVMMLGMTQTVFADETNYYEGAVSVEIYGSESISEILQVTGVLVNDIMSGEFTTSNGYNFKWTCDISTGYAQVLIDDLFTDEYGGGGFGENGNYDMGMKYSNSEILIPFWFEMRLSPSETPTTHQIATAISGSTILRTVINFIT